MIELDECRAGCRHSGHLPERAAVNGVQFDSVTDQGLAAYVDAFVSCGRSHVVHFCAAHPTVVARNDPSYRDLLNGGDLMVPDGLPVVWALRLLRYPASRITGTHALDLIASQGVERGLRHYFYGGLPPVLERLQVNLERAYPGIRIVGACSPPFKTLDRVDLARAAAAMRAAQADVVWVGLGAPKQDVVASQLRELGAAPALMCVGAAFDFFAGAKRRAPSWMQRTGTEWVYRLATEPRRLWRRYLIGNPQFVVGVTVDYVRTRRVRRPVRPAG